MDVYDRCKPLSLCLWQVQTSESKSNSMHESSGSRESSVFVCVSVYVWYEMKYENSISCSLVEIEI